MSAVYSKCATGLQKSLRDHVFVVYADIRTRALYERRALHYANGRHFFV